MFSTALIAMLPAVFAAGLMMLVFFPPWSWGKPGACGTSECPIHAPVAGAIAAGTGFIASFIFVVRDMRIPPSEQWHGLVWIAGAAIILAGCASFAAKWMRLVIGMALAMIVSLTLAPVGALHPMAWKIAAGVIVLSLWSALPPLAARRPGALIPMLMSAVFAGGAVVNFESGFATLSLLAGAMASAACVVSAFAWLNASARGSSQGVMRVIAAMLPSVMMIGWFYGRNNVPMAAFALPVLSPLMLWWGEMKLVRRMRPLVANLIRVALVMFPLIVAMVMARAGI